MRSGAKLAVREMQLAEAELRIDYFHGSSDAHLRMLAVDRSRLPTPDAWRSRWVMDRPGTFDAFRGSPVGPGVPAWSDRNDPN
jgi:hypothetical protein